MCVFVCVPIHAHVQLYMHIYTVSGKKDSLTGVAILAGLERGFSETWGEPAGSVSYVWMGTTRAWSCVS